jgi:hypothetical protein
MNGLQSEFVLDTVMGKRVRDEEALARWVRNSFFHLDLQSILLKWRNENAVRSLLINAKRQTIPN